MSTAGMLVVDKAEAGNVSPVAATAVEGLVWFGY